MELRRSANTLIASKLCVQQHRPENKLILEAAIRADRSIWNNGLEGDILRNAALFSSVDDRYAGQTGLLLMQLMLRQHLFAGAACS